MQIRFDVMRDMVSDVKTQQPVIERKKVVGRIICVTHPAAPVLIVIIISHSKENQHPRYDKESDETREIHPGEKYAQGADDQHRDDEASRQF